MIEVTVIKDDEIFATMEKSGEPYVWKIVDGKPIEIPWHNLPSGDYRLKLETKTDGS